MAIEGAFGPAFSTTAAGVRGIFRGVLSGITGGTIAGGLVRNPKNIVRAWKYGASTISSIHEIQGLLPAAGDEYKVGFRFGTTGDVVPLSQTPFAWYLSGMPEAALPVPEFGISATAVPVSESRFLWYGTEVTMVLYHDPSPLRQAVVLPAGPETIHPLSGLSRLKPMSLRGHQQVQPTLGGKGPAGPGGKARRVPLGALGARSNTPSAMKRRNARFSGRRPPYCVVHKRRHWCWKTRKR